MQSFLPYPDFAETAAVLDSIRLNKMSVEMYQIMMANLEGVGYIYHPATYMWRNYMQAAMLYQEAISDECMARGIHNTCLDKSRDLFHRFRIQVVRRPEMPFWLGDPDFHIGQQSNLVRKDPAFYGPLFPGVPDDLPYIWPVKKEDL